MSNEIILKDSDILNPEVSFNDKLEIATNIANTLSKVIEDQKLYSIIKGKKHIHVDGWALLGTILGCTSYVEEVIELPTNKPKDYIYQATVSIRYRGEVISRASAISMKHENNNTRERFSAYSMAQTRATGKAYKLPLGFIMNLAGYATTPAEDMPKDFNPTNLKRQGKVIDANDDLQVDDPEPVRTIWQELIRIVRSDEELELNNLELKKQAQIYKKEHNLTPQSFRELIQFIDENCPEDYENN